MTILSSRAFNQNPSHAKKAARQGPVFITNRGMRTHVLLTIEDYRKLTAGQPRIADLLAMPHGADVEFNWTPASIDVRPADLT